MKQTDGIIGYQGVNGAYSSIATELYFGKNIKTKPCEQFEDVAMALSSKEISYAVLPIENTSTGAINEVYDILIKYDLSIIGEKIIPIQHQLLGLPGAKLEDIKSVSSHIQGLKQCTNFLRQHPQIKQFEAFDTASSAMDVANSNDKTKASIASSKAGEIYGLDVIVPNIQNNKSNKTRFVVVSSNEKLATGNKVSVAFTLKHEPGSLYNVLQVLQKHNLNMTKLESRPIFEKPFEYMFYLDFEANTTQFVDEIKEHCISCYCLGLYQADNA